MSTQQQNGGYSARDIILRYESEEEEFVRELEQMMTDKNMENEQVDASQNEHDIDDGPPILSVLCSLVDEIGSLRTENRRLKTRLAPAPRAPKNVVQRMSAMFEQRGSLIFPRLRRSNRSQDSVEIRNGARERLSTPPRNDKNSLATTTNTTISTDYDRSSGGIPPIVRPEMSDSDEIDEQLFDDDDHRSRDTTRRCDSVNMPSRHQINDHSLSACTSPSSASSSRDPSETMTTSRSSFLDLLGFRRRSTHIPQPTSSYAKTTSTKTVIKKRRRKLSGNDSESSGMYANLDDDHCGGRLTNKPPRPASYYRRDDSEDSADCIRQQSRQRKATSFLNVNSNYEHDNMYRVDRETQMRHEKDNLMAEIEEFKMRNQRLVEQLREKSQLQSRLQCQLHKAEMQVNSLSRKCALSEALDRLTYDERVEKAATNALKKIEDKLRIFENQMQNAKLEAANAHQMTLNSSCHEKAAHQNCLEKLENLQREHMRMMNDGLLQIGVDEIEMKRRLENLPTYEALYGFTHSVVRRLNETRWSMIEKTNEASRAQMDLIASQSTNLVIQAQMERMRIQLSMRGKRPKRPASFHGHESFDRNVKQELNFYLQLKMQANRVETARRSAKKRNMMILNDRNIEEEFLKLFSYSKDFSTEMIPRRPTNRIETMIREMNGNNNGNNMRIGRRTTTTGSAYGREKTKESMNVNMMNINNRRPISMVDTEERRMRRNEETRRSIKFMKTNSIDHTHHQRYDEMITQRTSVHDIPSTELQSPQNTPVFSRRVLIPSKGNPYDHVPEVTVPQVGRVRKLERAFSTESRNTVDSQHDREERRGNGDNLERRSSSKIQRSAPVSRLKQPTQQLMRFRTMENGTGVQPNTVLRPRTLETMRTSPNESRIPAPSTRSKTWLDRIKAIGKS